MLFQGAGGDAARVDPAASLPLSLCPPVPPLPISCSPLAWVIHPGAVIPLSQGQPGDAPGRSLGCTTPPAATTRGSRHPGPPTAAALPALPAPRRMSALQRSPCPGSGQHPPSTVPSPSPRQLCPWALLCCQPPLPAQPWPPRPALHSSSPGAEGCQPRGSVTSATSDRGHPTAGSCLWRQAKPLAGLGARGQPPSCPLSSSPSQTALAPTQK